MKSITSLDLSTDKVVCIEAVGTPINEVVLSYPPSFRDIIDIGGYQARSLVQH